MPPVKLSARQLTVGTILGMGLLALFAEPFSSVVFDFLFGDMWRGSVRQALIDWGLSSHLVTHHVSFILLAVPHWSLWILVSFCLGLSTRRLAKVAAISFILWRLFLDLFVGVWFYFAFKEALPAAARPQNLFGLDTWVIPTVLTILFGFAAWSLGRRLNRRSEPGHCLRCGYDLTGNVSGICPECGHLVPAETKAALKQSSVETEQPSGGTRV
jgi:hypothetical protein